MPDVQNPGRSAGKRAALRLWYLYFRGSVSYTHLNKELVETMEDYAEELEASFKRLHEGDIVTGTVVAVTDDQVLVDLKYFAQGVIDRENLSNDPDFNMKEEIQPGDLLTATVIQKMCIRDSLMHRIRSL